MREQLSHSCYNDVSGSKRRLEMDTINSLGLLKDIKNGEYRVVLTPAEVGQLVDDGVRVMVASGAGYKAGV